MEEKDIKAPINKIWDKIDGWIETFIAMLPNMAVAIVLLILFVVLAKLIQQVFKKIFTKTSDNKALENLFSTIVYYVVLGTGIFIILGILKLDKTVTSLLAGVGVIGLALGFAFQDVASNFISGIILAFRRPFVIGDLVEIKDKMGWVVRNNLRVAVIETFQGQEIYIPNKDVLQSPITNYTVLGKRRIDIPVGISYGDDLEKVEQIVRNTIGDMEGVIKKDKLVFDYYEFGNSSINFYIRFWIQVPGSPDFFAARNEAIKRIKAAFDENDITIPFPIRTLDFGIKGGEKLSQVPLAFAKEDTE